VSKSTRRSANTPPSRPGRAEVLPHERSADQGAAEALPHVLTESLDSAAGAFAQLLGATDSVDAAFTEACTLAEGLFPHQVDGVAFLLGRRQAILADDMGLGKTRQAIVALRHAAPDGPRLVVCPASLKANWAREIHLVEPDAEVALVPSPRAVTGAARWVVVNYDVLARHADALGRIPWAGIVVDEAHYIKNHKSARSRHVREIAAASPSRSGDRRIVFALTGTPLTNRPRDLFTLLQLVEHPLGRSFLSFAKRYCDAYQTEYGWVTDGASNLEELAVQLHGVMLRRTKDQVLALPPKLRGWLPVDVPPGTGHDALASVVQLLLRRRGRTVAPEDEAPVPDAQGGDRVQLLSHLTRARHQLAVAKVEATRQFVDDALEQGEKVIVFSCFDEPIATLAKHYGRAAVVLTGKTPTARRQALVDRFQQDADARVFLANIIAGGTGLNLTAARQVVFNDLDWVPANHWQAEDRAYRIGQTGAVNVTYVYAEEGLDQFVQAVLEAKAALVDAVVEGKAVTGAALGNVLDDLERALAALSPRLADVGRRDLDEELVQQLLRDAARTQREAAAAAGTPARQLDPALAQKALLALAKALRGPEDRHYRVASSSRPGSFYTVTASDGGDVVCSCPGFEYRGACRHARDLKTALAGGRPAPAGYVGAGG
jgi:SWI/SNF-related matrix-associated actin-dependent regulator of chromatin subfamily A-like protein 1